MLVIHIFDTPSCVSDESVGRSISSGYRGGSEAAVTVRSFYLSLKLFGVYEPLFWYFQCQNCPKCVCVFFLSEGVCGWQESDSCLMCVKLSQTTCTEPPPVLRQLVPSGSSANVTNSDSERSSSQSHDITRPDSSDDKQTLRAELKEHFTDNHISGLIFTSDDLNSVRFHTYSPAGEREHLVVITSLHTPFF